MHIVEQRRVADAVYSALRLLNLSVKMARDAGLQVRLITPSVGIDKFRVEVGTTTHIFPEVT